MDYLRTTKEYDRMIVSRGQPLWMDIDPLDDGMPTCSRWHFTDMMFYSITIYTFDYPEMPFLAREEVRG
jgi:hypothetical protein